MKKERVRISRTETPVQFIDGHDCHRVPFDGHGDPTAPIPGQRRFSDGPSMVKEKFRKKIELKKLKIDIFR